MCVRTPCLLPPWPQRLHISQQHCVRLYCRNNRRGNIKNTQLPPQAFSSLRETFLTITNSGDLKELLRKRELKGTKTQRYLVVLNADNDELYPASVSVRDIYKIFQVQGDR